MEGPRILHKCYWGATLDDPIVILMFERKIQIGTKYISSRTVSRKMRPSNTSSTSWSIGEGIQVVVDIINQSPCSVTLKYILYRKQSRISPGRRITGVFPIVRKKAKPLRPHSKGTVRDVITIPRGIPPTISMGSPVELQYILKICLGMTGSSSTYLSMPIVVLPTSLHSIKQHQKLLKALTLGDTLYPNPNQQIRSGGNPPRKPRSMDTPMNY
ncbi:uncharacterized protein LOC109514160 isoform X2 [Hippocampus comes]|uniref:uncharacterized protein LOC109514160 isoform X2 n=1 Tax=Hippocampus comes TaxID=109280 RepID=UPI00094E7657|nr:PREDICTED: uncharacterized protein LOC109514160 isoform X2 [Hippocampus comes]